MTDEQMPDIKEIEDRVRQFKTMSLPGQGMGIWRLVQALQAENERLRVAATEHLASLEDPDTFDMERVKEARRVLKQLLEGE